MKYFFYYTYFVLQITYNDPMGVQSYQYTAGGLTSGIT